MTMTLALGLRWRAGYATLGLLLASMTFAFGCTRERWRLGREAGDASMPGVAGLSRTLACSRVWPGILLFFIYTGLEVAAGQWTYSLLTEARSVSRPAAGAAVSAYWGSFTVARLLAGALVQRIGSRVVLRAALMVAPVGGALLWIASDSALYVFALIIRPLQSRAASAWSRAGMVSTSSVLHSCCWE
jgi:fucose permease